MWSAPSIKHKLNELAVEGLIERRRIFGGAHETTYISDRAPENAAKRGVAPADAEPEPGRTDDRRRHYKPIVGERGG